MGHMVLLLYSLIFGWGAAGCAVREAALPAEVRYLALGDSYTIGESVPEEERWPVQLGRALEGRGAGAVEVRIIARTGWTTRDLLRAVDRQDPQGPYDLVSLQIGVNNQFQGRSQEAYREEFRELLERSAALAGGDSSRVLVLSIPDYSVTPFAENLNAGWQAFGDADLIREEIDVFNQINQTESMDFGARYVDITPISRRAESEPDLIASDGLHPSSRMYGLWVEEALPVVVEILSGR